MLSTRALVIATVAGTLVQLAMVITGHSSKSVANLFAVGGMGISLIAGFACAWLAQEGTRATFALGGAAAGGACALPGIVVSYLLGDVTTPILVVGTLSSAVTGAIGGWIGSFVFAMSRSAS